MNRIRPKTGCRYLSSIVHDQTRNRYSRVNTAMETEIEALRELNEANRAEIDRALSELEPMLKEAANA